MTEETMSADEQYFREMGCDQFYSMSASMGKAVELPAALIVKAAWNGEKTKKVDYSIALCFIRRVLTEMMVPIVCEDAKEVELPDWAVKHNKWLEEQANNNEDT